MQRAHRLIAVLLIALGMILAVGDFASAQSTPAPTPPPTGSSAVWGDLERDPNARTCQDYVGLTNRIVLCMRDTIDNAVEKYFDGFFGLVRGAVIGFLTLVVIVYGILAAYGMLEKPGRDVMILMVKLSFVVFFVGNSNELYYRLTDAMDAAAGAVTQYVPGSGAATDQVDLSRVECLKNMREAAALQVKGKSGGPVVSGAWLGMDCTLDSVIGIRVPRGVVTGGDISGRAEALQKLSLNRKTDESTPGMSRGLIAFFFSSVQTSVLGILLGVIGFVFLYTLIWLVLKSLFVYLAGFIGIAFLMIFAPIFIPLMLFRTTTEYFKKWVKLSLAFALQPIIILAFVTFAIAAIDLAMFSGDYSVMYRIAGEKSRAGNFNLNKYLEENEIITKQKAEVAQVKTGTMAPDVVEPSVKGYIKGLKESDCARLLTKGSIITSEKEKSLQEACQGAPISWWRNAINWEKMAKARKSPPVEDPGPDPCEPGAKDCDPANMTAEARQARQISREVLGAVLFATLAVLAINGLLNVIPAMVNDLVGESFQSPNLFNEISRKGGGGGSGNLMSGAQGFFSRLTGGAGGGR